MNLDQIRDLGSSIMSSPNLDLKGIFTKALDFSVPTERDRYLAEACGGDTALRGEFEALLRGFDYIASDLGFLKNHHVGDRVLAPWEAMFLYAGTVDGLQGDEVHIRFDDGDCGWVQIRQIWPLEIKAGLRVFARWKMGYAFYPGEVVEVQGESVQIFYDDGDKEWTKVAALRIPCIPRGPNARPTKIASGPGFFAGLVGWIVPIGLITALVLLRGGGCR